MKFDDELFSEPDDHIRGIIRDEINKAMKDDDKQDDNNKSFIAAQLLEVTKAFVEAGYSRDEAVYITGQMVGPLVSVLFKELVS